MARFRIKPLLESDITATIREMLERLDARTIKICGGPYQENGIADLLVCLDGKFIAIEVKRPGCKPTPLQTKFLDEIRRAGGIAFIASSLEDVVRELGLKAKLYPLFAGGRTRENREDCRKTNRD